MIVVTSWDDGHPSDLRIADLLRKYGLRGTFFVPKSNSEGKRVMTDHQIRTLDGDFEIGGHTLDHIYLDKLPPDESCQQIREGKRWLEEVLGHPVRGFCYPGGKRSARIAMQVSEAGFDYARTIENFRIDRKFDKMAVPTSMQFFQHRSTTLLKNLVSLGAYRKRTHAGMLCMASNDLSTRLSHLTRLSQVSGGVLHIWGHSGEIEDYNLWAQLDEFFRVISELTDVTCTVGELVSGVAPERL
jgi:hypothetical protein